MLGISVRFQATLLRCDLCLTYWEYGIGVARALDDDEARVRLEGLHYS